MTDDQARLESARSAWRNRGSKRPSFAVEPNGDQESVWDYPRPPIIVADSRRIVVATPEHTLVDTNDAVRILETASPPTFYFAPTDVNRDVLLQASGSSHCEWKGNAVYWSTHKTEPALGWSYPKPYGEFSDIAGWFSFYPARVRCEVAGEAVRPQPGGFYGGWMTDEIVGPVKGETGTQSW